MVISRVRRGDNLLARRLWRANSMHIFAFLLFFLLGWGIPIDIYIGQQRDVHARGCSPDFCEASCYLYILRYGDAYCHNALPYHSYVSNAGDAPRETQDAPSETDPGSNASQCTFFQKET